jgi:hypothetical protein
MRLIERRRDWRRSSGFGELALTVVSVIDDRMMQPRVMAAPPVGDSPSTGNVANQPLPAS